MKGVGTIGCGQCWYPKNTGESCCFTFHPHCSPARRDALRFLKAMNEEFFPDGVRQTLSDDQIGMAFYLLTGFTPQMKLKDFRAENRGDLNLGCEVDRQAAKKTIKGGGRAQAQPFCLCMCVCGCVKASVIRNLETKKHGCPCHCLGRRSLLSPWADSSRRMATGSWRCSQTIPTCRRWPSSMAGMRCTKVDHQPVFLDLKMKPTWDMDGFNNLFGSGGSQNNVLEVGCGLPTDSPWMMYLSLGHL